MSQQPVELEAATGCCTQNRPQPSCEMKGTALFWVSSAA